MAGAITVRVNAAALGGLASSVGGRLDDLGPFMARKAISLIRDSVAREFLEQSWFSPGGAKVPWRPEVPFGTRSGSSPGVAAGGEKKPLIDSGAYYNALMGSGSGGFVHVGPRQAIVGVEGSAFPYATYVRGGAAGRIRTSPLLIFPVTRARGRRVSRSGKPSRRRGDGYAQQWALWWYLGLTFGVWLRAETLRDGLKLYPRPHLTNNPELTRRLTRGLLAYVRRGEA